LNKESDPKEGLHEDTLGGEGLPTRYAQLYFPRKAAVCDALAQNPRSWEADGVRRETQHSAARRLLA